MVSFTAPFQMEKTSEKGRKRVFKIIRRISYLLIVKCHDIVDKKRCHNIVEFVL